MREPSGDNFTALYCQARPGQARPGRTGQGLTGRGGGIGTDHSEIHDYLIDGFRLSYIGDGCIELDPSIRLVSALTLGTLNPA
ncbi:hypothetical protein [Cryobacterium fucosi]|uniref:Uncharacterized protein n=1 Tax=Cryobacterium fucosi TaxID=1259157 RepID=A0A4R9BAJ6_9MICO|nr:hypothetical protein [Cryobacterium fucosi]TFD79205.1 hypothetical protein E3T48_06445 [Cryobacterium fucosi]